MSLDFTLTKIQECSVFDTNMTHNLGTMADKAGIYYALWRPEEKGYKLASDIIPILKVGLEKLTKNPTKYKKFSAKNGWGTYEQFVPWVEEVLLACEQYPDAKISVSR
jgi:hypothetical protein